MDNMDKSNLRTIEKSYNETDARAGLEVISPNDEWRELARCIGMTHLFYPQYEERPKEKAIRELAAKAICATCPVIKDCLAFALRNTEQGIWGGTNDEERYRIYGVLPFAGVNTKFTRSKPK